MKIKLTGPAKAYLLSFEDLKNCDEFIQFMWAEKPMVYADDENITDKVIFDEPERHKYNNSLIERFWIIDLRYYHTLVELRALDFVWDKFQVEFEIDVAEEDFDPALLRFYAANKEFENQQDKEFFADTIIYDYHMYDNDDAITPNEQYDDFMAAYLESEPDYDDIDELLCDLDRVTPIQMH